MWIIKCHYKSFCAIKCSKIVTIHPFWSGQGQNSGNFRSFSTYKSQRKIITLPHTPPILSEKLVSSEKKNCFENLTKKNMKKIWSIWWAFALKAFGFFNGSEKGMLSNDKWPSGINSSIGLFHTMPEHPQYVTLKGTQQTLQKTN